MRWSAISHDVIYSQVTYVVASPLLDTPDEIWMIIFARLDRSTLASLCLVAKRFQAIAAPFLYHDPFEILDIHWPDMSTVIRMQTLAETFTMTPSLATLVRVYRDVYIKHSVLDDLKEGEEDPAIIPRSVLKALNGITRAKLWLDEIPFIRFCSSRNNLLELEIQNGALWSEEELATVSLWLSEQQRVRRLVFIRTGGGRLTIPRGAFPELRNLTCDSDVAADILRGKQIHTFRCRDENLWPNTKDQLIPLMQYFSQHLCKVQLLIKVEDSVDIIKQLAKYAPYLTVLKLAISGPVSPSDIQATAGILCFQNLQKLSLRFKDVYLSSTGSKPSPTLGMPVLDMIAAWRELCPHLNQVTLGCFTFHLDSQLERRLGSRKKPEAGAVFHPAGLEMGLDGICWETRDQECPVYAHILLYSWSVNDEDFDEF
ncbi:hypothetical protein FRB93_006949 [Tulasnella sp. JGI-2019a]|nr:hypothetical protein FRB93_006949 [Tulasnella sp. JGI-2019a]